MFRIPLARSFSTLSNDVLRNLFSSFRALISAFWSTSVAMLCIQWVAYCTDHLSFIQQDQVIARSRNLNGDWLNLISAKESNSYHVLSLLLLLFFSPVVWSMFGQFTSKKISPRNWNRNWIEKTVTSLNKCIRPASGTHGP